MGILLSIDGGRAMGCALGPTDDPLPQVFTRKLKNTTVLGEWLQSAVPILADLLANYGVTQVAIEKPNTASSAYWAIRKNMALLGIVHLMCADRGLPPPAEIQATDAKMLMTGQGAHYEPDPDRPGKRRGTKQPMVDAATALGYENLNEHEADALGIHRVFVLGAPETRKAAAIRKRKAKAAAKAAGSLL